MGFPIFKTGHRMQYTLQRVYRVSVFKYATNCKRSASGVCARERETRVLAAKRRRVGLPRDGEWWELGGHEEWEKEGREWRETKDRGKERKREKKREKRKYQERYVMAVSVHVHKVKYTRTQASIGTVIRNTWYRRIIQSWAGLCLTASISPSPPTSPMNSTGIQVPLLRVSSFLSPMCPQGTLNLSYATPWHTSNRACITFGSLYTAVSLLPSPYFFTLRLKARLDLTIFKGYYIPATYTWYAKICMWFCCDVVIRIICRQNIHAIHIL